MLIVMNAPTFPASPSDRRKYLAPLPALLISLILTLLAWQWVRERACTENQIRFDFLAEEIQGRIADRMRDYEQVLRGGAALFAASKTVERDEWRAYVERIDLASSYPGIQGMGFSQYVPAPDRDLHVRKIRAEGFPAYDIKPAGERPEYTAIVYLEPFDWRNRRAFGYDMFAEPARRAAMEQARDSGKTALSGKVTLVQETDEDRQAGMLMHLPVYRKNGPLQTIEQRRAALFGYVYAPFRMKYLMEGILGKESADFDLELFDGEQMAPETLMHDAAPAGSCLRPDPDRRFLRTAPLSVNGHAWTLCISSLPSFEANVWESRQIALVLAGGAAIGLLWSGILWTLANTRARALDIAYRMTQALRDSEARFHAIFDQTADAIVLIDAETLRFAEFNQAACGGLGYTREEFAGLTLLDIQANKEPEQVRERVQAIANGGAEGNFEKAHLRKDGAVRHYWVSNRGIEIRGRHYLTAIWHDITEQKRAQAALRSASLYARNLIEASLDPLVTIDAEGKITDVNRATEEATGRAREWLIGSDFSDYFTEPEQARAGYRQAFAEGLVRDYPLAIAHVSGRVIEVLYNAVLYRNEAGEMQGVFAAARDITVQKRAIEALRAASLYARNLIEASLDPLVTIDAAGKITDVNRATEEATGRVRETLIGSDFSDYFTDPEQARAGYLRVFAEGLVRDYPLAIAHASGRIMEVLYNAALYRNETGEVQGVFAAARDITERKTAEEQLRKLSQAIEQSSESIVITNTQADIEYVNEIFLCNTGYTREETVGKNPRILKSGKTPPDIYASLWNTLAQGHTWKGEFVNRRKNGEEYVEFAVITPIRRTDGAITHYVAVQEDITERKRIGEELDRYRQRLEELVAARMAELAEAKEAAERANRTKSLFLANMSHEIRTPMNAVMGMTELCLAADPSERQRNYLSKIRDASDSLLHLIDDILDFSRIEADKLNMAEEPFNLAGVFDNLSSLLTRKAREKGLDLAIRIDPALAKRTLLGDPRRLGQILINLAGNAIKFSRRGQVLLSAEEENAENGKTFVHFAVQDEGIGLSSEEQARLFRPFTQADASTTRKYGGAGLGLAISKRLAEMMGGRIWVESELGRGSVFRFTAHFAAAERAPAERAARKADGATLARLRGAEILLVEDAEFNQEMMRDMLEQAGFRVRLAVNGVEALDAVARALPDCVLMDCQMPVMDGFEATRRLRALERHRDLPILALTANAMAGDREQCLAAGMNDFLAKPVDFGELHAALARWIRPRPAANAPAPALFPETASRNAPLPELPGIDTTLGLALAGGQAPLYGKLLRRFRDGRAGDFLDSFRAARDAGDWNASTRLAHTLKGSAKTLGAGALGELAARLEEAIRQSRSEAVAERLEETERELARVLAGLARLDATATATETATPGRIGADRPDAAIRELDRLLEEHDTSAAEGAAKLAQALANRERQAEIEALLHAVARYDYAQARTLLRALAQALESSFLADERK
jgi:PAS domain S-box-containing protein